MKDDKAFIGVEATNVDRTATGLEGSSASPPTTGVLLRSTSTSATTSFASLPPVRKSIISISAYDARPRASNATEQTAKRIITSSDHNGVPVTLNVVGSATNRPLRNTSVVQIGCFSGVDTAPKKLSEDKLKSFQVHKNYSHNTDFSYPVDSSSYSNRNNRSVTFISGSSSSAGSPKMMTMMSSTTAIPRDNSNSSTSSSPSTVSSKNSAELDSFALDSGTGSDLEINSSSSSLHNSITPPPPPLPKKMNKTKEKLKSENEKFFHLKNYQQQRQTTISATTTSPAAAAAAGNNSNVVHLNNDQDDNMSVLSCGSNNSSNCSSISLISCDSLNPANRRLRTQQQQQKQHQLLPHSPSTTMTSYSSSGCDSPTPSSVGGEDPPVIVSDPDKQNAIVLSVKAAAPPRIDQDRYMLQQQQHKHHMQKKNLLPTSLLADIRSTKRISGGNSNGGSAATTSTITQKNVNVINIRPSAVGMDNRDEEDDNNNNVGGGGASIEFHSSNGGVGDLVTREPVIEPEKYLSKKFINFSIHSMIDDTEEEEEEEDDEEQLDKGYFEGGQRSLKHSAFASMNSRKSVQFENDNFYNFHLNENNLSYMLNTSDKSIYDTNEDSFAGYRDLTTAYSPSSGSSTIRSNKGTIRGVKNRVRNGIATFLQMNHANIKVHNNV